MLYFLLWFKQTKDAAEPVKKSKSQFSGEVKGIFERNKRSPAYAELLKDRQNLPVFNHRENVLEIFRENNVFIVAGETGSGKSTQIPQFILEVCLSCIYCCE